MLTIEQIKILNTDYSQKEILREDINFYRTYQLRSGDVRLNLGLIRTEAEQKEFISKGLAIKLPGCE